MEITTRVTEYTVCALPEDHIDADIFAITVAYRGHGLWAVLRGKRCLDAGGTWWWEPIPSERTDEWKAANRFDEETALRLAREAAPTVVVNGWTAESVLAQSKEIEKRHGLTPS
ncbi:hypothetical protein [Verrucosispora sp. WMMD1129]|uniref:hypothetical protein n=1 Tax=Verrucosispora sp. WMMD1129 TaxID=3016093 RepID=UPI002499F882|nr:hypothetical protein [Verrucosispora sp. WMMD1129]WFE45319.1 hypothetical protein O7624_13640 [Verrucosispora sp. WMMD1129]